MRLHHLGLTAFGSFRDTQHIDFDALSGAGLFLVVGATGAGKSTILDAVTFALYGAAAGDRGRRGLRSDHAPAGVAPQVVLEVTIRGRRLRITRSPEWTRPKQRGQGTVTAHPTVLLEEGDGQGGWTALTTRLDEAGHLVTGLLGMSREQFCQVALLPQNAFARFLQADSDERRSVLERLFAARLFTTAEAWLAEHRTRLGRERDQARRAVTAVADRIAEVAEVGVVGEVTENEQVDPDDPVDPDDADDLVRWAAELHTHAQVRLAEVTETLAHATTGLAERQKAVEQATRLAERQQRYADHQRRAAELAEAAPEHALLAAELDGARRADRVIGLLDAADRHTAAYLAAEQRFGTAWATATAARLVPAGPAATGGTPSDPDTDALVAAERSRRDEASRLEVLLADVGRLADLGTELDQLSAESDKLRAESDAVHDELAGFADRDQTLAEQLRQVSTLAAGLPGAQAAVQAAQDLLRAVRRRAQVRAQLDNAEAGLAEAATAALDQREHWLAVREARLAGMAAELAGTLADGDPCPVCGATEHPSPTVADTDVPTRVDELVAQRGYDAARAHQDRVRAEVEHLRGELTALAGSTDQVDQAEAAAALAARTAELDRVRAAGSELAGLEAARSALTDRADQLRERAGVLSAELATAQARHRDRHAEAATIRRRLDQARGEDATLAGRITRLTAEADLLADVVRRGTELRSAVTQRDVAVDAAGAAAVEAGFATLDEVRAACRDAARVTAMETALRRYDDEEAAVRSGLEDPELRAAAACAAPDLDSLHAELAEARGSYESALREESGLAARVARIASLREELRDAMDAWRPAAHRYQVAHRMAQLAQGTAADNRWRMRLSAYVLAARMEQVVAEANHRLADMSDGRYLLSHSTDRRTGERHGGLGLRVTDNWTGRDREPATLSGGEKFYVSLSLALGLMAVVTAEAGGVELDTLFVDEGFGALDEDTLDDVMGVLDTLREGGRAVGIVSHVAELRTRIPTQLRVTKTPTGSTVHHHTG